MAAYSLANNAITFGAVLGYALARTWPDSIDQLADWPARALALAGADNPAGRLKAAARRREVARLIARARS